MRLPLQPMSSAASSGAETLTSRTVDVVTADGKKCEDGCNDENLLSNANCVVSGIKGQEKVRENGDLPNSVSVAKEGLSLVERRAALFNNIHKTQRDKRTWSKPSKLGLIEASNDEIKAIGKVHDSRAQFEQQERLGTSLHGTASFVEEATNDTSFAHSESPVQVASRSRLDFERNKKAISNFASQSMTRDLPGKGGLKFGKSHFAVSRIFDAEEEVRRSSAKASEKVELRGDIISIDNDSSVCKEQTSPCEEEVDMKDSARIEVVKSKICSTKKYTSPAAGATTAAVFSPSPHLLKPSQMNLKNLDLATFSDMMFRNTAATSAQHDDGTSHVRSTMNSHLESKLLKPLQMKERGTDFVSGFSNALTPTNFPSKLSDVVSPQELSSPYQSASPRSHVGYSHPVKKQDNQEEIGVAPTLSPHFLSPSGMTQERNIFTQKTDSDKPIRDEDFATKEEETPISKVFSDIIGFTSSFSEALVSPRNKWTSPLRQEFPNSSNFDQSNKMAIETATVFSSTSTTRDPGIMNQDDLFSDFADFSPVVETNYDSQNEIMGQQDFFDSSFDATFDAGVRFSFPREGNFGAGQTCDNEDKVNNRTTSFANFESECEPTADELARCDNEDKVDNQTTSFANFESECEPTADELALETESVGDNFVEKPKGLEEELNEILNIMHLETPNKGEAKEHNTSENETFVGNKVNELISSRDTCTVALNDIKEKNFNSPRSHFEEKLPSIDEIDEDYVAQAKYFKDRLNPELCNLFTEITLKFDRKVNELERKIKNTAVENSVIKEEMCHQHEQIQSLMVQLESSRDMVDVNRELMQEIEDLRVLLQSREAPQKSLRGKFIHGKKKINKTLKNIRL